MTHKVHAFLHILPIKIPLGQYLVKHVEVHPPMPADGGSTEQSNLRRLQRLSFNFLPISRYSRQ